MPPVRRGRTKDAGRLSVKGRAAIAAQVLSGVRRAVIHLVVGLPHPFTEWCVSAVAGRLAAAGRTAEVRWITGLPDLARAALTAAADDIVCVCPHMDEGLAAMLGESARGPLVAIADPREALLAMAARGDEALGAFRYLTACCASVNAAAAEPRSLCLEAGGPVDGPAAAAAAAAIDAWIGASAPPGAGDPPAVPEPAGAPPAFAGPAADGPDVGSALAAATGDPPLTAAILEALAVYPGGAFIGHRRPMRLLPRLFVSGMPPHAPLAGPIDVTGVARYLAVSGYVFLPSGDWDAVVRLEVDDAATDGVFSVEIDSAGRQLGQTIFRPAARGLHEIAAPFRVTGMAQPVDARLCSQKAMFDGSLSLAAVEYRLRR